VNTKLPNLVITSDFICPWCWIGHRNLKRAIAKLGLEADDVTLQFAPFELNPDMPVGGQGRQTYRTRKIGNWARSQAMDAEVTMAGRNAGVEFNYERVLTTPNTRLAHRLMFWAAAQGDKLKLAELPDEIFSAYFSRGLDIGDAEVLVGLAALLGFDAEAARVYLTGTGGEREVAKQISDAARSGIRSVPNIKVGGEVQISGAQASAVFARAIEAAIEAVEG